jgi:hypothetical protein
MLEADGVSQDVAISGESTQADFDWIHYRNERKDIYFISNQSDDDRAADFRFRASGKQLVLWDPVLGTRRVLPEWKTVKDATVVPMRFASRQSFFLVFDSSADSAPKPITARNFPETKPILILSGDWQVSFDPKWGGPANVVFENLEDWTKRPEEGIKFYSGTATYRKKFDLPNGLDLKRSALPIYLDLGMVKDLAEVRLNGKYLGVVWTAPWRIDIRGAAVEKGNELEIDVINQWPNRLIGDSKLPPKKQFTKSNYKLGPDDPLVSSGLLGPVILRSEE